ncbi:regulatory LuxR family protein [Thioclava sp. ES.031]|uniref:helix-turn-helix transcriptional regulator n=1 Tax=Thioclava sp. ES.031 TaxID=1798203 RepID=UPI000BF86CAC|nr:response regulator transcription factor [Thioclava sp. ES.031]PFG63901.1 regulatory LuxR family protein [Thioclava sp. ES.031]
MNTLNKEGLSGVSRAAPRRRSDACICFVGPREIFSDVIVRTLESEVPDIPVVRVDYLEEIPQRRDENARFANGDRICALIVEEGNAAGLKAFIAARGEALSLSRMRFAIAYSEDRPDSEAMDFLRSGALLNQVSFLPMNINITTWMLTLRIILSGGHVVPPALLETGLTVSKAASRKLAEPGLDLEPTPDVMDTLTRREREVLQLLASGQQNKNIADRLQVSEHTAKIHTHRIINKLGVSNRTAAAVWYHRHEARASHL